MLSVSADIAGGGSSWNETDRYRALLGIAEAMISPREVADLFCDLADRLQNILPFGYISFALHDPALSLMHLYSWEAVLSVGAPLPIQIAVEDTASTWVWEQQQALTFVDIESETRFPEILNVLRARGIRSFCLMPMSTTACKLGTIGIGSSSVGAYKEVDITFIRHLAMFVAAMAENALTHRQSAHEREHLRPQLDFSNAFVKHRDFESLFSTIARSLRTVVQHDVTSLTLYDEEKTRIRVHTFDHHESVTFAMPRTTEVPLVDSLASEVMLHGKPVTFRYEDLVDRNRDDLLKSVLIQGVRTIILIPITTCHGQLGTMNLFSFQDQTLDSSDTNLLMEIATQVGIALENATAFQEIAALKERLAQEKHYLEDEIRTEHNFEQIVGESEALKKTLVNVELAASSGATVLLLGETGTGKELIARAIHNLSIRNSRTFVKLNCAAIPAGLLESELFGHEKGAFTGAINQRIGYFELADKGTLFLDEVGDIPLELQPKLLRALQEQEFERLGSTRTIHVNARLIAATNRDLGRMVTEREFRSDLFYRLNVFPIRVPPLRERRDDIPKLVCFFVKKFANRMGKKIETIPKSAQDALAAWHWPGNVRELENIIERSVILSRGPVLQVPIIELELSPPEVLRSGTLADAEREHIIGALRESAGIVSGPRGAALRLGLKRSTLLYKMEKLGISRYEFRKGLARI
jgi:formate hydrogenlyase transcriptional activator